MTEYLGHGQPSKLREAVANTDNGAPVPAVLGILQHLNRTRRNPHLTRTHVAAFWLHRRVVLVRVPDAQKAFDGLKAHGVLVKNVSTMHPLLANCLRLTVGTHDENTRLLEGLRASL